MGQRKLVFRYVSPSAYRYNLWYVYFNLTLNQVMYICVLYFDLAYFRSIYI